MSDRLAEMNIAPCFFRVIIGALFSVIIIWVDKLFGKNSERGYINFLFFIENNVEIFGISQLQRRRGYPDDHWMLKDRVPITFQTIKEDRDKIEKIEALANIRLRRDKFHAHFDKEYFFDRSKIDDDAPLTYSAIEQIIEVMGEIINRYSAAYNGNLYDLKPLNTKDIDILLDTLYRYRMQEETNTEIRVKS